MTREGGALSVQRGDLVAGRYRTGEPLGPAWRARDETSGTEVLLVPVTMPQTDADSDAGDDDSPDVLDTARWQDRRGVLPPTDTATGDAGAWLVTESIPARTLADAVEQWGALPAEQVLLIAAATVTALAAPGPRIAATPDHILLTDDGQVLLLPIEATEDDLATLGTALHLAAEGHVRTGPIPEAPSQPTLAPLISALTQNDADRATTFDRAFAELSRLGAPLDAAHSADALHEAQAASAAAAEDAEDAEPGDGDDESQADTTHRSATEVPTQPMSAAELLADTATDGEGEATKQVPLVAQAAADDATQQVPSLDSTDTPTRQVAALAAADSADEITQQVPSLSTDTDTDPDTSATRPVPIVDAAPAADDSTREIASPDDSATRALPIPSGAPAEPSPTKPEPLPAGTNPFVAPVAGAVPPTQVSDAVPPAQGIAPTQAAAPPQPTAPPQPIPPNAAYSAAPPTQAAAAVPPPGAPGANPNPWLQPQQPQPPIQPQPQQGPWHQGAPAPQPQPGPWGPGPGQPPPYFPPQGPPPGKGNGGKTAAIIIGAVVAVAAVVSLVVVVTRSNGGSSDNINNAAHSSSSTAVSGSTSSAPTSVPATNFPTDSAPTSSSDSSNSPSPSDSSSDTASSDVTDTASPPALTSTPFDPTSLNAMQTDKTPLEVNALVPQEFTDDKGVHYTLKAGSVQPCVQTDMSSNMQDILTSNSCSKEIAASFVDDSGQYLVSVKVLPLPDHHTATTVYNDLSQQSAADFGIWCPESGPGSDACQGDYQSATLKQYREQQHRYIILSVALAVNHSQSTSIAPWRDAAAKKAVDAAGPLNWSGNQ